MKTKLMMLGGCACLMLAGCASPRGGTAETPEGYTTNYDQGVSSGTMATPDTPSSMNPRDMRDPQAVTIPHPPLGPQQP